MDRLWFVPVCVTRTVALGTAASVESTTEPTREPYNACAAAVAGFHTATTPRKTRCNFVIIAACVTSVRIAHAGPKHRAQRRIRTATLVHDIPFSFCLMEPTG